MPLFYQHNIEKNTRLAIWKIEEPASFFLPEVPVKRDITHPQKQLQHLAGRYLLPYLFPDFPNREIVVADTHKPYLPKEQYHFSISHCGDFVAVIVSKNARVGIDIEAFSQKIVKVKNKFLTAPELDLVTENDHIDLQKITAFWSAKEAIYKWWSYGDISLKNNIHIEGITTDMPAQIQATLEVAQTTYPLSIEIKLFETISLCWLMTKKI